MSNVGDADELESQSSCELIERLCGGGKDIKTYVNIDRRVQDPCRRGTGLMTYIWYIHCSVGT